jgi:hypothetical protein
MRLSRLLITILIAMLLIVVLLGPIQSAPVQAQASITACPNQSLVNAFEVIVLPGDCTLPAELTITSMPMRPTMTIRGNGHTLTPAGGRRHFTINASGRLILDNVTLAGGSISSNGGALYVQPGGVVTIQNGSVLRNNRTTGTYPAGGFGGAIFNNGGIVIIKNSTLRDNRAHHAGGAILNQNSGADPGILTVKDYSTLSGNSADHGGAIYNGAIDIGADGETDVLVMSSALIGNRANNGFGGAITNASEVANSRMDVFNSTFSGNWASQGGAISVGTPAPTQGPVRISNNTFSGNGSPYGNAIHNDNGQVTMRNNIIANGGGCYLAFGTSFIAASDNLAVGGSCGGTGFTQVSGAALRLGALQMNGGTTQTVALLPGSVAIDAVTGSCVDYNGVTLTVDQRGKPRPVGGRCDAGAFEYNPHQLTVNVTGTGSVTSNPAGVSCGADCDETLDGMVTLTAAPATENTVAWGGCNTASGNTCTVDLSGTNRTVTALFTPNPYTLSVSKDGLGTGTVTSDVPGIDCGAVCATDYSYGTAVTLTAAPAAGTIFTGWSGPDGTACGMTTTCAVTVDQARAVTASFGLPAPAAVDLPAGPPVSCDQVALVDGWGIYVEGASAETAYTVPEPPPGYRYLVEPAYDGYCDLFTLGADHSALPVQVCWNTPVANVVIGLYHDQPDLSRTWTVLPATVARDGLCASLPGFGGVALLTTGAASPQGGTSAGAPITAGVAAVNCTVTTTHIVNFRAAPNGEVLTRVPYETAFTTTVEQGGWYQVEWQGQAGWISADYVTAICD